MKIFSIIGVIFLSPCLVTHIIHPLPSQSNYVTLNQCWACDRISMQHMSFFVFFCFLCSLSTPNHTPLKYRCSIKASNQIGLLTYVVTLLNPFEVREAPYGPEDAIWCCLRLFILMHNKMNCKKQAILDLIYFHSSNRWVNTCLPKHKKKKKTQTQHKQNKRHSRA